MGKVSKASERCLSKKRTKKHKSSMIKVNDNVKDLIEKKSELVQDLEAILGVKSPIKPKKQKLENGTCHSEDNIEKPKQIGTDAKKLSKKYKELGGKSEKNSSHIESSLNNNYKPKKKKDINNKKTESKDIKQSKKKLKYKASSAEVQSVHSDKPVERKPAKLWLVDSSDEEENEVNSNCQLTKGSNIVPEVDNIWSCAPAAAAGVTADSSDDDIDDPKLGERKKRRRVSRRDREAEARLLEATLRETELRTSQAPQTEYGYKEMLLSNSSCSATWIHYISYLLSTGAHDKAEAIARRALSVVPFEEQKERINLWTVLLRLKVMYDNSSGKTVEDILNEAANNCDDFIMRSNMAGIYEEHNQFEKAEAQYVKLRKKYYAEKKAWEQMGLFYYKLNRLDEARDTLSKAMVLLNKRLGVDITSQFAGMELKYGDKAKCISMFESVLNNYPKRLDIWHVYANMFAKAGDVSHARNVFTRLCSQPMNFNKKLSTYNNCRRFEAQHGTTNTRKHLEEKIAIDMAQEQP